MKLIIYISFFVLLVLNGCTYEKENVTPKISGCDTTNVSYSRIIQPILSNNCYSCHSTTVTSTGRGLDLENFTSLKNYLNYQYHMDGVYGSKFFHIVNHSGLVPYMPPALKLSSCELRKIYSWLNSGAPQN
jgi:hypothetical protein